MDWNRQMKLTHAFNLIATNRGYTLSELAKRTRLTYSAVNEWITRLGPLGVYSEERGGREILYFDMERWA